MPSRDPSAAADGYERWLAEKLWDLIPAHVRAEDVRAGPPGALRQLVEVIAGNAAELRRSQDRLWDDSSAELADPWAVPYLGELVGTRLLQTVLGRAQRIDVAKTIYYRRRAGTPRVLEELIADITGREGVVREQFRRLGRAPHGLDPEPPTGALTGTPAYGLADLRSAVGAELAGGPFDEYHHTPDLRRPQGTDGRYGITRLAVHRYRLEAWEVEDATPRALDLAGRTWSFDPSGRDVPLFARRSRGEDYDYDQWRSAREAELPLPIRCRLLGHCVYVFSAAAINAILGGLGVFTALQRAAAATFLTQHRGVEIVSDGRLRTTLEAHDVAFLRDLVRTHALDPRGARATLLDSDNPSLSIRYDATERIPQQALAAGVVEPGALPSVAGRSARVDPARGRFALDTLTLPVDVDELVATYHYGFLGYVGAGPWDRDTLPWADAEPALTSATVAGGGSVTLVAEQEVVIGDNRTCRGVVAPDPFFRLSWRAADQTRPYVLLTEDLILEGAPVDSDEAVLILDGLWLGAADAPRAVELQGSFERVEIRACSFDPGGEDAVGDTIHPVLVRVTGYVEQLIVQSSVLPRITVEAAGGGVEGLIQKVCVADSVLDSGIVDGRADTRLGPLVVEEADVRLARTTALGWFVAHRLWATDSLIAGAADVFDTQNGCFRFSGAHEDSRTHLPHPYESAFFADAASLFVSTTFGDPGYAQLSDAPVRVSGSGDDTDALASIVSGAEDDGEMGAFHDLYGPLGERALRAKYDEYMPFGLLPLFVHET